MSNIYNIGDLVKLKSGGPNMSVEKVMTNTRMEFIGKYRCQWFAGKKADTCDFPEASLVLATPEK
jgi:uncharacterized protein YodC (DUF2158 family)